MRRAIVGLGLIGLVACADTGTTVLAEGSIDELEARWNDLNPTAEQMSSFTEEHRVGDVVSEPLTIRVQDRTGRSFSHLTVDWTVHDVQGGVSLSGDSVFASTLQSVLDANGTSSVEWRLGHSAGAQRVSVRVSGPGRNNKKAITADFELTALPGEPMELTLNPDAMSVEEGDNALASALMEDQYGNEVPGDSYPLVWHSRNSSIAHVDEEGIVSAVGEGSTIVTVAAGYMMDSTTVSVMAAPDTTTPPTPASLQVNPSTVTLLELGATRQLSVSARDQYGDPISAPTLSWATADGSIATVSSSGLMTATGLGSTTVTASAACCSSVEVAVSVQDSTTPPPPPAPAGLQANPSTVSLLELGASTQLGVTATDQYGDPIAAPPITWSTADGSIATVNSGGLVTSIGVGSTTVTGTADCCSSVQVSVSVQDTTTPPPAPATLEANPSTVSLLELGTSAQLGVTATDQYGDPIAAPTINWSTADGSIATVNSSGLVTSIGVGSTTVTGTADCCSSVQVAVSVQDTTTPPPPPPPAPAALQANPSTVSLLELGASAQLGVTATDQYGDPIAAPTITWSTADGSIATVNGSGLVTSIGVGSTTVTGTADCCSSVQVSVSVQDTTSPPPPPPPAQELHFATEWERTGTGLTDAEQLAGEWGIVTGRNVGPASQVVDSDAGLVGRGDYFRVNNSGTNSRQVQTDEMVPASTTHWGRVYVKSNNTTSRHNHTIGIGSGSGHPIEFAIGFSGRAGGSTPFITVAGDVNGSYPGVRWWAADVDNANNYDNLAVDQWYLIEWQIEYLADPTHYRVRVWVHEADRNGAITTQNKWASSDFYESDQPGTGRDLAGVQATGDYFGLTSGGSPDAARRYSFGNEGPAGGVTDGGYMDFASFAISLTGRIGATVVP